MGSGLGQGGQLPTFHQGPRNLGMPSLAGSAAVKTREKPHKSVIVAGLQTAELLSLGACLGTAAFIHPCKPLLA